MGNVRDFPTQRSPIEEIAKELIKDKKNISTALVITRDEKGNLTIQCYSPDASIDDLLAIKQVTNEFTDAIWRNGFES